MMNHGKDRDKIVVNHDKETFLTENQQRKAQKIAGQGNITKSIFRNLNEILKNMKKEDISLF